MVLAVQHSECQGPQVKLEVWPEVQAASQDDVRSRYISFGMAKALRSKRNASCEKMCCNLPH